MSHNFEQPQRQSALGIILIFSEKAYKFIKAFWIYLAVLIFSSTWQKVMIYALIGMGAFVILSLIYSYLYYRKFLFSVDIDKEEFILTKGVFSTDTLNIPFSKIQQVDLKRSILQRIIGVYSLKIDTAGSKDKEIEIKAVSKSEAQALSQLLIYQRDKTQTETAEESYLEESEEEKNIAETDAKIWQFHLSLWRLIKIGLTRSYFRGLILMLAFVSSIYSQIHNSQFDDYFNQVETYSETHFNPSTLTFLIVLGGIVLVFVLSVLVTIGEVILKHFNLNLEQTKTRLTIEMGLKTNTRVSFQPRRLQRLEISTNPIQKRLNLHELKFSLASSDNNMDKSKILVPGLSLEIVERVRHFLYQNKIGHKKRFKLHKAWMNRRFYVGLIPVILFWIYFLSSQKSINPVYFEFISVIYLGLMFLYQVLIYKSIRLEISNEFLIKSQGWWTQKTDIIEIYKMEGVTIKQPFWYKRRKIYNLTFHTAGGDMKIRAVPESFLTQINFILYKVETAHKAWM